MTEPRWQSSVHVQPVQLDGEEWPQPRTVRLSSPAARPGDPVRVMDRGVVLEGVIAAVRHSVLHVARARTS